jgi:hypothetical protein
MRISSISARVCLISFLVLVLAAIGASRSLASPQAAPAGAGGSTGGDIPDTATYLVYHGKGYHLEYVEGWGLLLRPKGGVIISDKDSSEAVQLGTGTPKIPAYAKADLARLARTMPKFHFVLQRQVGLAAGRSIRAQYRTLSPRDPVTNKQVPVLVDRYYIPGPRKYAILTLETPVGVDNVDAFRRIAQSFRWG